MAAPGRESNPNASKAMQTGVAAGETVHHSSRQAKKGRDLVSSKMQISMTPLIDVIFQLQIYFLITAAFTVGEGVVVANLPQGDGPTPNVDPTNDKVKIVLTEVGQSGCRIYVQQFGNNQPQDFEALGAALKKNVQTPQNPTGLLQTKFPVVIQASQMVRWQHVVNAFNQAIAARFTNISFPTGE